MTYALSFLQKEHYLHATVTGENTLENVLRYLQEVTARSRELECPYLLIEENLAGPRQDMAAVFEIASQSDTGTGFEYLAVAYVDTNAQGELMEFAETVAVNRAIPVKLFQTVSEAESWLTNEC